ncbi:MAG TPA: RNA polymerase sigma factor [Solirubrobacteraceae bacterium]|nr:RNA polymerase sigma factor [Solirubrobacteraceae bacterium]
MEVSALRYSGAAGRHGRSPLLKLQSDERLVGMVRRGNQGAFEVLVARYNARLLAFCRHMLGSREDAEDVLQDVFTASYNAMLADDRPINVRPWLYRIARNRCLNHLRRNRAIGVDSMDIHFAEHGASTADKVHEREEFRQLLHDIRDLPETQRTALALREMDALSYEQIAEAMETSVSSVKSLLVRARVSLTEAAEARLLSCDEVREELAEIAEGLRRKQSASVRRHVKNCSRCEVFQGEMKKSSRALAALAPIGPLAFLHKLLFAHAAAHSAGSAGAGVAGAAGAGAGGAGSAGAAGAGTAAAGAAGAAGGAGSAGLVTAGVGAVATKAAAGIAAAALVTAGTVAIDHPAHHHYTGPSASTIVQRSLSAGLQNALGSTHLPGAVGAGPGLSVAVIPARAAKAVKANVAHIALTVGSTVSRGSQATTHATSPATKPTRTDSTAQTHSTPVTTPPAANLQSSSGATPSANSTGGVGLAAAGNTSTSATPTTDTTATTFTTSTPTDTTGAGTTATGTATGTATSPTGTDTTTGTSTSPTTTAPSGTTTAPTGTTTAPTSTTTTPEATTTDPSSTTNPSAPTTGTTTATP